MGRTKVKPDPLDCFLPDPELKFDPVEHRYSLGDSPLPGVTEILQDLGVADFSRVPVRQLRIAQVRGTYVHKGIMLILRGDLDWDTVDPELLPYLESFKRLSESVRLETKIIEEPMANKELRYAGRGDWFGLMDGRPSYIDWKSGMTGSDVLAHRLSTKAYDMMLPGSRDRYTVKLRSDGKTAELHPMKNRQDGYLWEAAVALFHEKRRSK